MKLLNNLLRVQSAYRSDMWFRHNLKVSLHRNKPLCGLLSRRSLRGALHIELLATVLRGFK
jgi:hypothetical protein